MVLCLSYFKKITSNLAHPIILFWIMPFMIILLVVGTLSQKELGILKSQEIYFSSYFYSLGFIPLPGGMTLILILFVNLLAKFIFKSEWSWARAGTIISHFGILVLILGGGISYISSYEGYLTVQEGHTTNIVEDYHERMVIIRQDNKIVYEYPFNSLYAGQILSPPDNGFSMTVTKLCYNCGIVRRPENEQDGWTSPGKFMQLVKEKNDPQDEKNMTGIEFTVSKSGTESDGKYLTFDKFPKPPQIIQNGKVYQIAIERARRELPFSITFQKFTQDFHAGTDMAKSYQSMVTIVDGQSSWPVLIEMNEPLRYRGYTFYQSSFDLSNDKPYTILAVVDNKGRIFPYIATSILMLGLIMHLGLRLSGKGKNNA